MNLKSYFKLNWKRFVVIISVFVLLILLHEHLEIVVGDSDSVFFIVAAMVLPIYIVVSLVLSLILWIALKSSK
jgi:hypothetical protein